MVTDLLERNRSNLAETVNKFAPYVRVFANTLGNGRWFDSFVNDLNPTVASSTGMYKGNVFAGGQSVTGGTADPRNNLESVDLPAGSSGNFAVRVTAANSVSVRACNLSSSTASVSGLGVRVVTFG